MNKTTCIPNIRPSIRQTVDLRETETEKFAKTETKLKRKKSSRKRNRNWKIFHNWHHTAAYRV